MNNNYNEELKVNQNRDYINKATAEISAAGRNIIRNTVQKKVDGLRNQLKKVPEIYQNMKNNLTSANKKEIKNMNENIANTGNHTAGGYAISKRLSNINNYNKQLSDIDNKKRDEIADIQNKINDTYVEGELEIAKLNKDIAEKKLNYNLDEIKRIDDYNLNVAKLNETKRMNDADIVKINNDMMLDNSKAQREEEIHDIEVKYLPSQKEAELRNADLKGDLTKAQIEKTNKETQYVGVTKSSTGSKAQAKETDLSKMSSKDISESIKSQIGKTTTDSYGNKKTTFSELDAFKLLKAWQKKYNLPDYKINDAAIYLGIQDFF